MQIGEAINVYAIPAQDKDPSCEHQDPTDPGWQSRVNKYNSQETCTGSRLYTNMNDVKDQHEAKGLGVVPGKVAGKKWALADVSPTAFPIQAHHLIPKSDLPKYPVVVWLAIKYKDNKKYELVFDSKYDTDHHNNGYCMPYARCTQRMGREL